MLCSAAGCLSLWIVAPAHAAPTFTYQPGAQLLSSDGGVTYQLAFGLAFSTPDAVDRWYVQYSTNNGASWWNGPSHVWPTTTYEVDNQLQGTVMWYRAVEFSSSGGDYATSAPPIKIWAEMQPRQLTATVIDTNTVQLSFSEANYTETGYLVQRSTNADFTTIDKTISTGPGTNSTPGSIGWIFATDHGFSLSQTYYYRAWTVDSHNGYYSPEPSKLAYAAPNALPLRPTYFSVANGANGVNIQWMPDVSLVQDWMLNVSVGNTNSWTTIYSTTNSGWQSTKYTDNSETAGTTCYYQVVASNAVGLAYSDVKSVTIPTLIGGSVWYIDCNAPNSNESGTSWANAWTSFANIAWVNVKPGALIWIAKGHYPEVAYCNAVDGTSNAPIVFQTAQDPAHKGKVYLNGISMHRNWVWWDGEKDTNFIITSTSSITNNINLVVGSTNVQRAITISQGSGQGINLRWIECNQCADPWLLYTNQNMFGEGTTAGIWIKGNPPQSGNVVRYCWVHDLPGDGMDVAEYNATNWGAIDVDHCVVERVSGNFITGDGGDYYDNLFRDELRWPGHDGASPPGVHPDGAQMWPPYLRMWNNVIRNTTGQALYMELARTNVANCYIYNNIVYSTGGVWWTNTDGTTGNKDINSGLIFTTEPYSDVGTLTCSNVIIANNTFYGFRAPYLSVNRRVGQADQLDLRNWLVANNVFYDANSLPQQDLSTNDYTTSDVVVVGNDVCGANTILGYGKGSDWQDYPTMSAFDSATGFTNNFSYKPSFANVRYQAGESYPYDFHLRSADATNMVGVDLSAYESVAPGISRNQDGTARAATGWPVGALSVGQSPDLILWYSFNNNFSTNVGCVADDSSYGNNGIMFSAGNWPTPTNGVFGSTGASFTKDWNYTANGFFGIGQYVAITNMSILGTLPQATFTAWVRYYDAGGNYANDGTASILDCLYNNEGGYHFGRYSSANTRFLVYTNNGATSPTLLLTFPDTTTTGDTTNYNFYAVTFDGTNVIGYYNGVPFQTNTTYGVTNLVVGGAGPTQWLGISCWPHGGTPQMGDDEYPNAGWMHGAIDDLRIYNTALSASQIKAVMAGNGISQLDPGGGNPTSGAPPSPPSGLRVVSFLP